MKLVTDILTASAEFILISDQQLWHKKFFVWPSILIEGQYLLKVPYMLWKIEMRQGCVIFESLKIWWMMDIKVSITIFLSSISLIILPLVDLIYFKLNPHPLFPLRATLWWGTLCWYSPPGIPIIPIYERYNSGKILESIFR